MSSFKIPTMTPVEIRPTISVDTLVSAFSVYRGEGYRFPGESHNFWEMVYISEGYAGITAGSQIYKCHSGALIFHKPNEFHRIWNAGKKDIKFTVISFYAKGEYINALANKMLYLDKNGLELMHKLQSEIEQNGPDDNYMPQNFRNNKAAVSKFVALLEFFLYECVKAPTNIEPKTTGSAAIFTAAVKAMNKHIDKPLKANELAEELHISLSQLKRIFNRYALTGVHEYFLDLKIAKAKDLLSKGESVYNTAFALGFSNQNNFSATFKRETGTSPSKWANRNPREN